MKTMIATLAVIVITTTAFSFSLPQEDIWKVPANYNTMKNPIKTDQLSIKNGQEIYISHCKNCHGIKGMGDGKKSASLNSIPSDFTSPLFQKQTDGALLYKIYFGHKDMPGFKNRIPDNDDVIEGSFGKTRSQGDLVNYLRTFAK